MYFAGINPIRAFSKDPKFAWHYYVNSGIRAGYLKCTNSKLRLKNYGGGTVLCAQEANEVLKKAILTKQPFMFGRYGSTELNIVTEYLIAKKGIRDSINLKKIKNASNTNGLNGLFPVNHEIISKYGELIIDSSYDVDLFGTFRMIMEDYYIKEYMRKDIIMSHLYMMDFWQYANPFTAALKEKKVLVIHPFVDTIVKQYSKREKLFTNPNVLPEFDLKTLKAVQTIAGKRDERFNNFFQALDYLFNNAMKTDFDIAILGCGAYGFPLAARLKRAGKIAILMGGVTQMLFGIKGRRWDNLSTTVNLYNKYWVRPDDSETPNSCETVEGGCYW